MNTEQVSRLEMLLARVEHNRGRPRVSVGLGYARVPAAPKVVVASPSLLEEELPLVVPGVLSSEEPPAELASEPLPLVTPRSLAPATTREPDESEPLSEPPLPLVTRSQPAPAASSESSGEHLQLLTEEEELESELAEDERATVPPVAATPSTTDQSGSTPPADESDAAPDSGHRARREPDESADSLDAALSSAAESYADEATLHTPPPESGAQYNAVNVPPEEFRPQRSHPETPTSEQLGDIIELEEGTGPSLELAELPPSSRPRDSSPEELEFVPSAVNQLTPPVEPLIDGPPRETVPTLVDAAQELAPDTATDLREESAPALQSTVVGSPEEPLATPAPDTDTTPARVPSLGEKDLDSGWGSTPPSRSSEPASTAEAEDSAAMASSAPSVASAEQSQTTTVSAAPNLAATDVLTAETTARISSTPSDVWVVLHAARGFRPTTFLELLDASLGLGRRDSS